MKKNILMLVSLFLLILPFVNSAIELNKDSYALGETVVAKLILEYAPNEISTEHVNIYDGYGKKVSVPFYIVKFSDSLYYIYFTLPTSLSSTQYNLSIGPYFYGLNGVLYRTVDSADINIVVERIDQILAFDPGAAVIDLANQNYFYLNLKNNGNSALPLSLKIVDGTLNYNTYNLQPGDSLKIKGIVNSTGEKILQIVYDSNDYRIPILVVNTKNVIEKQAIEIKPINAIKFINLEDSVNIKIGKEDVRTGIIKFMNYWTSNISNVKLIISDNLLNMVELDKSDFGTVKPNDVKSATIIINKNKNINKDYIGEIKLIADGVSVSYPVYIYYTNGVIEEEQVTIPEEPPVSTSTEKQELEKQKELKTGVFFSIIAIVFVVFIVAVIIIKSRKDKPKDFISSRR